MEIKRGKRGKEEGTREGGNGREKKEGKGRNEGKEGGRKGGEKKIREVE
ncbi:hypothetical protein LI045_27370 [Bacteroides thetaiotaomicron]|nr:hypothetical protein [Bacteroides thetaiotaomicron]MCB7368343.1 hypothetical protein [Bacteroides thetaiotaomicron]